MPALCRASSIRGMGEGTSSSGESWARISEATLRTLPQMSSRRSGEQWSRA